MSAPLGEAMAEDQPIVALAEEKLIHREAGGGRWEQ
jgi:hypothetical protein